MAGETQPQKVVIDLDEIWEPAGAGILRASLFAALGTNAARDPNLTNFDLPGLLKFSYSRSVPHSEEIRFEFERWILASAFREAVESFALALDGSYQALLLGDWVKTGKRPPLSRFRRFFHAGVEKKLETICTEFGVTTAIAPYFVSLNKARNCLAHRMGVVGPMDLTEGNALVVRYRRMEFVLIEDNGREEIVPVDAGGTFQLKSPCHRAEIRFEEEQRRFVLGTRLLLEPSDVKYIFWTLNRCGLELKSSIVARLREMGFPVNNRDPGEAKL
jgi:hypothetical protein